MLKLSEIKVLSDEETAGIDKACESIDKLIRAGNGNVLLKIVQAPAEVIRGIARRYESGGWIVSASYGGAFYIQIKHPHYHNPSIDGWYVGPKEYAFDFSQPEASLATIAKSV